MIRVDTPGQFLESVRRGDLPAVEAMIAAGIDVNVTEGERTPLALAIEHLRLEIVGRLIAAGADVNHDSGDGWTPLVHAIDIESDAAWQSHHETGHETTDLTRMLLESGALPDRAAFDAAERYGNLKATALLLQHARRDHQ